MRLTGGVRHGWLQADYLAALYDLRTRFYEPMMASDLPRVTVDAIFLNLPKLIHIAEALLEDAARLGPTHAVLLMACHPVRATLVRAHYPITLRHTPSHSVTLRHTHVCWAACRLTAGGV